jgi:hypothetical protein
MIKRSNDCVGRRDGSLIESARHLDVKTGEAQSDGLNAVVSLSRTTAAGHRFLSTASVERASRRRRGARSTPLSALNETTGLNRLVCNAKNVLVHRESAVLY